MAFMGVHTKKEVSAIKRAVVSDTKRQMRVEFNREKNKLIDDYENRLNSLRNRLEKANESNKEAYEIISVANGKLKEKDSEIDSLKNSLNLEYDKQIGRLEALIIRTNKNKIKKKCRGRILDYMERKFKLEQRCKIRTINHSSINSYSYDK